LLITLMRRAAEMASKRQKPLTIFWAQWGPLMQWSGDSLLIEDLNPEIRTKWVLTRRERLLIGLRFIRSAFRSPSTLEGEE
jgi:hypothetical protein